MQSLWSDLRYGLRTLAKSPGFAAVAVVTLALGIGASTAIFSVIENVLMEPFPYTDSERFMAIQIHDTSQNEEWGRGMFSVPEFLDYAEKNHVFDRAIGNSGEDVLYTSGEGTEMFRGYLVTPGTFEFLGMPPLLGRAMYAEDYRPGTPPVFCPAVQDLGEPFQRRPRNPEQDVCPQWYAANIGGYHASALWVG